MFDLCSIPQLLLDTVFHAPEGGLGLQAYVSSTNTVFLFVAICVAYGMVSLGLRAKGFSVGFSVFGQALGFLFVAMYVAYGMVSCWKAG